jgi:hypothetical protein
MKLETENYEVVLMQKQNRGYFESKKAGVEGGLWFRSKELVDADGTPTLPTEVASILRESGYEVSKDFE